MSKKISTTLLASCAFILLQTAQASTIKAEDPMPNVAAVKDAAGNVTKTATGGLRYKWWITMGGVDTAELIGSVGAKSSYEPTFKAPDFMWTHTSNWVALDLSADAMVTITIKRQMGVQVATLDTKTDPANPAIVYSAAGNLLNPVISVYKNWEENTADASQSNPIGRAAWQKDLDYLGIAYAENGATTTTFKGKFLKGKYTLGFGGANAWPNNGCKDTDTACYTGNHGYIATITTSAN